MKQSLFLLLLITFFASCTPTATPEILVPTTDVYTVQKQALDTAGIVVTAHPLATQIGREILQQGGNAIDAMVAVQFALAVAYPRAGNIGGGGFLVYRAADGEAHTLDFREKAPALATANMYLDSDSNAIDSLSIFGHLAVGVPGAVEGMWAAHQKFGKMDWKQLLQPAIEIAQNGVPVTQREADSYNEYQSVFDHYNPHNNAFVREKEWQAGDLLVQSDLGMTLLAIQQEGRAGFYEGKVAQLLVDEMQSEGGIIQLQDLKEYQAIWRKPLQFPYKNYNIIAMPPPSSGGLCLAEMLNMIEDYPIGEWGFESPKSIHLMTEAARRAYADRAEHLGDMDFYDVPVAELSSQEYARERMQTFQPNQASISDSIRHGYPLAESDQTTHYSIVDGNGNAVSITTTINSNYGSKVLVEGAGFFLNNEMDDFSAKPGSPNQFGLIGNAANAIAPHKRMLSSMTPTIVEKDDQLLLVVGTPGGSKIITTVFQVIVNVIEFEMPLLEAVHKPRFHFQWLPDTLYHEEDAFSPALIQDLQKMGHATKTRSAIGQVEAILVLPDGRLEGVADTRGDDSAEGSSF